ncbi:Uncharacterized UPF0442 protein C7D4.12c [Erysiphe neolycopersici]|uniref:Uncharacterized UPF0442 protein C7D4.12c n=1 Tax=Erysiphe neolycopersici TaxID=212602 RepID=A0A420I6N6_9PEZI|nr:Uncharacterized UPF0442 protein C7D4.12c [Erysiphe neolycopersici]
MSKVFSTKDKNNSYYYTPTRGQNNDGEDTIQLNAQEEVEPNRSIEENQDLEEESSDQKLEESVTEQKQTTSRLRQTSLKKSKYNFTGEASTLNPNIKNSNSTYEPKVNSVVVQNKASNVNMSPVTTARMFSLKESAEEIFNPEYRIDSKSAGGDRTKKIVDYQKTATQRTNFEDSEVESQSIHQAYPARSDDVALLKLDSDLTFDGTDSQEDEVQSNIPKGNPASGSKSLTNAAVNPSGSDTWVEPYTATPGFTSGQVTPIDEKNADDDMSSSRQYNDGILSSLARLYSIPLDNSPQRSDAPSIGISSQAPGIIRPKMGTGSHHGRNVTQDSLPPVAESPATFEGLLKPKSVNKGSKRGIIRRLSSATLTDMAKNKISSKLKLEEEVKITIHIAETQSRRNYLLKLCRALMAFGAPTHRLEEYLRMSARVLEVQGSFLYIPGCMIISFDDATTHTNEVKLVKVFQALNLGLLVDVHEIYKEVVHDVISVEEATHRLDKINSCKPRYNPWTITLIYGFASAFVAPWAFQGRYIDMPICFILGSIVGFLQHVVAPKCDLYNNVFEIAATVITSFLARAFGSIQDGNVFCFSALAQSSLALMLPGYIVLCGCLEIQSKSLIAGSVRMIYGIIYSFFLGFGISVGTAFYGLLDSNATNATTCHATLGDHQKWAFVPLFTLCAGLVNQARFKQLPVMITIGFAGYIVNFLTFKRFPSSAQISNTLGALTVGLLGNVYARMRHGVAAAAIVPALLVLVPSGIAASGSLLAGLSSADKITTGTTSINGTSTVAVTSTEDLNKIVFNVGNSMVQIAIGLTVGLFMSTLLVYPLGKRRSGLFAY